MTVEDWNKLPEAVVSSESINQFKGQLRKYMKNDPLLYLDSEVTIHPDPIKALVLSLTERDTSLTR